jgi:hypothetical protein
LGLHQFMLTTSCPLDQLACTSLYQPRGLLLRGAGIVRLSISRFCKRLLEANQPVKATDECCASMDFNGSLALVHSQGKVFRPLEVRKSGGTSMNGQERLHQYKRSGRRHQNVVGTRMFRAMGGCKRRMACLAHNASMNRRRLISFQNIFVCLIEAVWQTFPSYACVESRKTCQDWRRFPMN